MYSARTYCTYFVFRARCANIISQNNKRKFVSMQIAHLNLDLLHNLPFVIIEQKSHLRIYSKLKANTLPDRRMHWQKSFDLNCICTRRLKEHLNLDRRDLTRREFRRSHTQHRVGQALLNRQVAFCRRLRVFIPFDGWKFVIDAANESHDEFAMHLQHQLHVHFYLCATVSLVRDENANKENRNDKSAARKIKLKNWIHKSIFQGKLNQSIQLRLQLQKFKFRVQFGKETRRKKNTKKNFLKNTCTNTAARFYHACVCMFAAVNGPLLFVCATRSRCE